MKRKIIICTILIVLQISSIYSSVESENSEITVEDDEVAPNENEPEVVVDDIKYTSPSTPANAYIAEHFDDDERFSKRWIKSEAKKEDTDDTIAKYDGEWQIEPPKLYALRGDQGLVLKSKAKHAAIAARFDRPFTFKTKRPLIVQYEVALQDGQICGGSYIKLLSSPQNKSPLDLRHFTDRTPYTIMFGPDKCGTDHKLHFIFRHKNPLNGTISEKHCKKSDSRIEEPFKDKQTHLYTLIVNPDNSYSISLDNKVVNEGNLLDDFTPSVNPPVEIDDLNDKKPEEWDEREKIPDPEARKPEDWNEEAPAYIEDASAVKPEGWLDEEAQMIPDPNAVKPDDWESEMDGEWEAPLVDNPKCTIGCGPWKAPQVANPNYKGKWRAPFIDNVNYKGKWAPRRIPNPDYYEDKNPFQMTPIEAVGIELWSMSSEIFFDNILVTDDLEVAKKWTQETFNLKRLKQDKDAETLSDRILRSLNYRTGWWGVYFVYCLIPIGVYVWYLWRRVVEESFFARLLRYTNDKPWLWALYIIIIGIPIVLIIVFCCGGSSDEEKQELLREAEAKKTDALSPDDEDTGDKLQAEESSSAPARSKAQLEVNSPEQDEEEVEEDGKEDEEEDDDEEEEEEDEGEGEGEAEAEEEEIEIPNKASGDAPPSPRKRKARKD